MAIPTDFKGFTPSAGTTKTFKLLGSATTGHWVCDVDGTLSAATKVVPLDANSVIVMSAAFTDAQLAALLRDWLTRMGYFHDGAGGQPVETTKQVLVTATTTS